MVTTAKRHKQEHRKVWIQPKTITTKVLIWSQASFSNLNLIQKLKRPPKIQYHFMIPCNQSDLSLTVFHYVTSLDFPNFCCNLMFNCRCCWLLNVTVNDNSVIYVMAHRCAGRLNKKFDLQSGSHAIDICIWC